MCTAALVVAAPARATQAFDGAWSVEVLTERGACEPVYRYHLVIADSAVHLKSMMGEVLPDIAGRIARNGRIDSRVGSAEDPVSIRGRLERAVGGGTWDAPVRGCSGRWQAEKRG